mmetsp:Transcript_14387/g.33484  ORF Transcript_14387/g.33484 Transcript_14387/m.33484 type:complete len:573 (+) Transcript_14387:145-1863(+)
MRFFRPALMLSLQLSLLHNTAAFTPGLACRGKMRSSFCGGSNGILLERSQNSNSQLSMMFDQLSNAISTVVKDFGKQRITEESIKPALRSVRRALLDADVNIDVADALIDGVKKRSLGEEVLNGVSADQQFIKAMYDELVDMMGGDSSTKYDNSSMNPSAIAPPASTLTVGSPGNPAVVLLAGLQGAGKTTAAGKLALYLKEREVDYSIEVEDDVDEEALTTAQLPKRNRKVLLAAADVYRPAAITQLEILGKSVDVEVFSMGTEADPVDIAQKALEKAKSEGFDTLIVDTAGRQIIDDNLMNELQRIKETVKPDETLLVVDAMTGQEAASLTAAFDSAVGLTGAILTKMDGDSRGGAAVSVRGVSGKPIKFVGTGERTPDLEPFYPNRMASRILGMGDVLSLVEKAQEEQSAEEAARISEKMKNAEFDFDDFLKQAKLVSKMGSLGGVAKMMPGIGQISTEQLIAAEKRLKKNEAMIAVMTEEERKNPDLLIKDSKARERLERIAKFSEMPIGDVRQFMSEFQKMRTMMSRQMNSAMAGKDGGDMPKPGNRAARRAAKKKKKGRGGGGGFG